MDEAYWSSVSRTSGLCKPLAAILMDSLPLSLLEYFIQHMESIGTLHLVQFWLTVQSFKLATSSSNSSTATAAAAVLAQSHSIEIPTAGITSLPVSNSNHTENEYSSSSVHSVESHSSVLPPTLSKQSSQTATSVEALNIYSTYLALNALSPVEIPDSMRQRIEVAMCPEDGKVERQCFDEAQDFVFKLMEERYYPGFLRSSSLCKFQLEYISSGQLQLLDFLLGENALFYFMEFMEQEQAVHLLQFWLMAENFRTHLSSTAHQPDIARNTDDAIAIYERHFSLQASDPLDLGDAVRLKVENKICHQDGPRVDSFAVPQQQVYDLLRKQHYPAYLESSTYLKFLNELVHNSANSQQQAPTGSGDSRSLGKNESRIELKLDVDDPDSLWMRAPLPFRLGFVDGFGHYTSEIEPIPHRHAADTRKSSRKRNEEELAISISRNIVTDVLALCSSSSLGRT